MRKRRAWRRWHRVLFVFLAGLVLALLGGFLFGLATGDNSGQLGFDALFVGTLLAPLMLLGMGFIVWGAGAVQRMKLGPRDEAERVSDREIAALTEPRRHRGPRHRKSS